MTSPAPLPIALLPFTATSDIRVNAANIENGIAAAAATGARVLLTPECSLPGYPSAARPDLSGVDWCLVAELEDHLALVAERHDLLLVLGTAGAAADGGFTNDALCLGGFAPIRYRKQCLTPTDRACFAPGIRPGVIAFAGWRLGLAICYDLRFPDVFMRLGAERVDGSLVIAHMAGPDPDPGTKAALIPQLCAVRAAELATPLAFCNTSATDRYCDSAVYDARGARIAGAANGLFTVTLTPRESLDPWYANLRAEALARWRDAGGIQRGSER